jgi:Ca-activated chloride channel family protein
MLVFDASQSMAAADADNEGLRRIDSARAALARILPSVAPKRRLGLITYGPGSRAPCANISLQLPPQRDAAKAIQNRVNDLKPAGRTPLTSAVRLAAEALGYRDRPATIVLVTDGEESCGGAPCELAKALKARAPGLTVHVVSYKIVGSLGSEGRFEARCLADETGGLYVATETADELAAALEKVLGCPIVSDTRPKGGLKIRWGQTAP